MSRNYRTLQTSNNAYIIVHGKKVPVKSSLLSLVALSCLAFYGCEKSSTNPTVEDMKLSTFALRANDRIIAETAFDFGGNRLKYDTSVVLSVSGTAGDQTLVFDQQGGLRIKGDGVFITGPLEEVQIAKIPGRRGEVFVSRIDTLDPGIGGTQIMHTMYSVLNPDTTVSVPAGSFRVSLTRQVIRVEAGLNTAITMGSFAVSPTHGPIAGWSRTYPTADTTGTIYYTGTMRVLSITR